MGYKTIVILLCVVVAVEIGVLISNFSHKPEKPKHPYAYLHIYPEGTATIITIINADKK